MLRANRLTAAVYMFICGAVVAESPLIGPIELAEQDLVVPADALAGPVSALTANDPPRAADLDPLMQALERQIIRHLPPLVKARLEAMQQLAEHESAYDYAARLVGAERMAGFDPVHQVMLTRAADDSRRGQLRGIACFAPGTSPELIDAFETALFGDDGLRYFQVSRWSQTATDGVIGGTLQGRPTTLTYSFAPDGTFVPNIIGFSGNSNLFAWLNGIYGSPATWQALFQQVFDRWSQLCGLTYVYEPNDDGATLNGVPPSGAIGVLGVRGDLRIAAIFIDGSFNILAYNNFPNDGDMVFDSGDNFYNTTSGNSLRLRNVAAHEHGHGMGQLHVCPENSTKLMEPTFSSSYDGPRHDDIRNAQRHYGDPNEIDDSSAAATYIGALNVGAAVTLGDVPAPSIPLGATLSIDANGEQDWFRFNTTELLALTVTLSPIGQQYDSSPQCSSGNIVDSLAIANLSLQIYASNGTTLLASAAGQPAGIAETVSGLILGTVGDYYIRVLEANTPQQSQLYKLTISATDADCNNNTLTDNCDLDCTTSGCSLPGCGLSFDCNTNNIPDECEADCNVDGLADECAITSQPVGAQVCPGDAAAFSVTTSNPLYTFQWKKGGVPLTDDARISGSQTAALTITDVQPADDGDYTCEIFDGCPLVESNPATLDVVVNGAITQQPPGTVTVCSAANVIISIATGGGNPPPSYEWYKDGQLVTDGGKYSGATTASLNITSVTVAEEGSYACQVSSGCGIIESDACVLTIADPEFGVVPLDTCAEVGSQAIFTASATAPAGLTVSYRWQKWNGSTFVTIAGQTTNTLTLNNVQPADATQYRAYGFTLPDPVCITYTPPATLTVGGCTQVCPTPGDMDQDGDYDLADLQKFSVCFGADVTVVTECLCGNVDTGNDLIDLNDWALLESLVTTSGPG